jgi:hypothetical protein
MKRVDYTGRTFGRCQVLSSAPHVGKHTKWNCICACGNEFVANTDNLRSGNTISCGCYRIEVTRERSVTHGESAFERRGIRTPEYRAWTKMKERCYNPGCAKYMNYGARGIRVCDPWIESFSQFLADVGRRPEDCSSVGRIDVDKDYEPSNVRWENDAQQARAKTTNVWVQWGGERMIFKDAAAVAGVSYQAAHWRYRNHNVSPEQAIRYLMEAS